MTRPESHCQLVAKVGQASRFPDFQARGHSSEPCCPCEHPGLPSSSLTRGPLTTAWTRSTLPALPCPRAFAPAVPPAWHTLSGSTLPGKRFTPSQRKWKHLICTAVLEHCASLDLVRGLIFAICYIVEFMCLSLHLISGSQRAKLSSCSSLHPAQAWYRASFQSMLLH